MCAALTIVIIESIWRFRFLKDSECRLSFRSLRFMCATMFRCDWCEKRHWTKRMLFIKRRKETKKRRWKSCYHVWTRWHMIFICILPPFGWEECLRSIGDSSWEWKWQEIKIILSFLVKTEEITAIEAYPSIRKVAKIYRNLIFMDFVCVELNFWSENRRFYWKMDTISVYLDFVSYFSLRFVDGSRDSMLLGIFVNFANSDYFEFD